VFRFGVKDFAEASAGQYQETNCHDCKRVQSSSPIFRLGRAVRLWFCPVNRPFEARRLGEPQGVAEPGEFRARKVTLARVLRIAFDSQTGIPARAHFLTP
jgi:hypothetical protein